MICDHCERKVTRKILTITTAVTYCCRYCGILTMDDKCSLHLFDIKILWLWLSVIITLIVLFGLWIR